jgi:hypothetical protein
VEGALNRKNSKKIPSENSHSEWMSASTISLIECALLDSKSELVVSACFAWPTPQMACRKSNRLSTIQALLTTPLAKYTLCFTPTIGSSAPSGDRRFTMLMGISSLFDFSRIMLSPWKDGAMRRSASVQESFVRACVQLT